MWITRMEGKWEFERWRVRGSGGGSEGEGREEDAKGAAGGEISVTEVIFYFSTGEKGSEAPFGVRYWLVDIINNKTLLSNISHATLYNSEDI